jgi:hypothetical protein
MLLLIVFIPGQDNDDVAKHKVQSVAPGTVYLSGRYDQILRNEFLNVLNTHPLFVFFTIAAKLGIELMVVVIFANVGLCAALFGPKAWPLEIAFWMALFASALPALIVAPATQYIVGLVSMSALYGIFSLDQVLERTVMQSRRQQHGCTMDLTKFETPSNELVALSN